MQSKEQHLIDSLFSRLKETETKTGPRDLQAEQQINQYIHEQPSAPYYMAQAMIIQEAALKQMDRRVKELEGQVTQLQQNANSQQRSRGFLADLFGGRRRDTISPHDQCQVHKQNSVTWKNAQQEGYSQTPQQLPYTQPKQAASSHVGGFLGGALQTAAGVAGGVVLADMLTGMFRHSQPQEIMNILEEPSLPIDNGVMRNFEASNNLDTFNNGDVSSFLSQDNDFQNVNYQDDTNYVDDYKDDDSFL